MDCVKEQIGFAEMNVYKNVLEQDVSREEREKRRERVHERKAEWEKRGKNVEKSYNK